MEKRQWSTSEDLPVGRITLFSGQPSYIQINEVWQRVQQQYDTVSLLVIYSEFWMDQIDRFMGDLHQGKIEFGLVDSIDTIAMAVRSRTPRGIGDGARTISKLFRRIREEQRHCEQHHGFIPTVLMFNRSYIKPELLGGRVQLYSAHLWVHFDETGAWVLKDHCGSQEAEQPLCCPQCGQPEDHRGMQYYPMDGICRWT